MPYVLVKKFHFLLLLLESVGFFSFVVVAFFIFWPSHVAVVTFFKDTIFGIFDLIGFNIPFARRVRRFVTAMIIHLLRVLHNVHCLLEEFRMREAGTGAVTGPFMSPEVVIQFFLRASVRTTRRTRGPPLLQVSVESWVLVLMIGVEWLRAAKLWPRVTFKRRPHPVECVRRSSRVTLHEVIEVKRSRSSIGAIVAPIRHRTRALSDCFLCRAAAGRLSSAIVVSIPVTTTEVAPCICASRREQKAHGQHLGSNRWIQKLIAFVQYLQKLTFGVRCFNSKWEMLWFGLVVMVESSPLAAPLHICREPVRQWRSY